MYSTAYMSLTVWDQNADDFGHTQLAANWNALDQHDHSNGRGVQIGSAGIAPNAVTSTQIAPNAVGSSQLAPNAVATSNVQTQAITNSLLAPGSVRGNVIPAAAITSSMLDPTVLPLGTVLMYYRAPSSSNLPGGGWEIMDGRAWNLIPNSLGLTQGYIPDMRGVFPMGADITAQNGPAIAAQGGSNSVSLAHAHGVNAHSHSLPVHTHPISSDGSHSHTFANGFTIWTRPNAFLEGITVFDWNNQQQSNIYESLYLRGYNNLGSQDQPGAMDTTGSHNHTGATGLSAASSTGVSNSSTDTQLGSVSIVPQYVGLLFIMRVR